jgi:ATP-dependent DNA helicase RecG
MLQNNSNLKSKLDQPWNKSWSGCITNPGGLPKSLTMEKFGTLSVCRNPLIASLLQHANYIEKMGTGIFRIKKALKDADNPEPVFDCDSFFTIIFKRSFVELKGDSDLVKTAQENDEIALEKVKTTQENDETTQEKIKTTQENDRTTQETTPETIISLIRKNPEITRNEMAEIIGLTSEGVKYNLTKMIKAGIIKHVGPTKKGYWQIIGDKKE